MKTIIGQPKGSQKGKFQKNIENSKKNIKTIIGQPKGSQKGKFQKNLENSKKTIKTIIGQPKGSQIRNSGSLQSDWEMVKIITF